MLGQQQLLIKQLKRTVFVLAIDLNDVPLQQHFLLELFAHLYLERLHTTILARYSGLQVFYLDLLS